MLVTGYFAGSIDFGGGPLTATGTHDVFVAKLDALGNHVWSRCAGDAATASDVFVLEYSPAGKCLQARRYGDTNPNDLHTGRSLATDTAGNVYVYGDFMGTLDVDTGTLTSHGALDTFLLELAP